RTGGEMRRPTLGRNHRHRCRRRSRHLHGRRGFAADQADEDGECRENKSKLLTHRGGWLERKCPTIRGYSSLCSAATTLKSSSVVVSPFTSPPAAISFNMRRMIFPLRVFGRPAAKRIVSGLASEPISLPTWARNCSFNSSLGLI